MWVLWTWFIHFVPKCVVLFIDIDECWGEVEGEWISLFVYVQWEYIQCDPHWSCLQLEAVHNPSSLHLVEQRFNTRLKSVNLSGLKCCGGPELLALWCSMWEESHSGPYTDPRHLMLEVAPIKQVCPYVQRAQCNVFTEAISLCSLHSYGFCSTIVNNNFRECVYII